MEMPSLCSSLEKQRHSLLPWTPIQESSPPQANRYRHHSDGHGQNIQQSVCLTYTEKGYWLPLVQCPKDGTAEVAAAVFAAGLAQRLCVHHMEEDLLVVSCRGQGRRLNKSQSFN